MQSQPSPDILLQEQRNAVARFLDARDMKREALEIATDADYRFDLAVSLGELGTALGLAEQSGSELKWRQLGELALSAGKLQVGYADFILHDEP
jgi:coatomer subunit beta'